MQIILVVAFAIFCILPQNAFAKDVPAQVRLFAGGTSVDPTDLNQELEANSLKKIDKVVNAGVEGTFPLFRFLEPGIRLTKILARADESNASPLTEYSAEIDQTALTFVARVPFVKTSLLRVDAFAAVGGTNTTVKWKTATQDGELSRRKSSDWFAEPYTAYGASVAVGYKKFYFVVEGGMQMNQVDDFTRTGTVNSNVNEIDLGGGYLTVGLMFDGLEAKK